MFTLLSKETGLIGLMIFLFLKILPLSMYKDDSLDLDKK